MFLPNLKNSGFSLVELSIVLVILGLLTGGILAGQSLIRAAELRSVTTEYARYVSSVQMFRDKYFALPGDFRDSTRFWGRLNGNADCVSNSSAAIATPGACDGNGSGLLDDASAGNVSGETTQLWRQLSIAGLAEGSYTGITGAAGRNDCPLAISCPRSRFSNAGWSARYIGNFGGDAFRYALDYGHYFHFGGYISNGEMAGTLLKPEEAWNIDLKADDGMPGQGKIVIRYWPSCTNSTAFNDYLGTYKLDVPTPLCSLYFRQAF